VLLHSHTDHISALHRFALYIKKYVMRVHTLYVLIPTTTWCALLATSHIHCLRACYVLTRAGALGRAPSSLSASESGSESSSDDEGASTAGIHTSVYINSIVNSGSCMQLCMQEQCMYVCVHP
jgi:hypothetical protein